MSEPLEYGKPASRSPTVLGIISIVCAPSLFLFAAGFAGRINSTLLMGGLWGIVLSGLSLGVLGIVYSKCLACGYSLTGNTSGVCPECGTAIESKPAPNKSDEFQTLSLPDSG